MLNKLLGSSPRTSVLGTIAGISGAAATIVPPQYQKYLAFVSAVCIILLGRGAKDSDGITKQEDVTVAQRATNGAIPPESNSK